jgi:hypothetical protein
MTSETKPLFPPQPQNPPGTTEAMRPVPDHGASSYVGKGPLTGKKPSSPG